MDQDYADDDDVQCESRVDLAGNSRRGSCCRGDGDSGDDVVYDDDEDDADADGAADDDGDDDDDDHHHHHLDGDDFDIGPMLNYSGMILLHWLRWSVLWGSAALGPPCWRPSSMG